MKVSKKKKVSLWIGISALTTTAVVTPLVFAHSTQSVTTTVQNDSSSDTLILNSNNYANDKVDYQQVRDLFAKNTYDNIDSINDNLKNFGLKQMFIPTKNRLTLQQKSKVKQLQTHYLNYFEKNHFNLNQINSYLSNNFNGYYESSEKTRIDFANKFNENVNSFNERVTSHENTNLQFSQTNKELDVKKLSSITNNLYYEFNTANDVFIGLSAAAAVAAAGFWAAERDDLELQFLER